MVEKKQSVLVSLHARREAVLYLLFLPVLAAIILGVLWKESQDSVKDLDGRGFIVLNKDFSLKAIYPCPLFKSVSASVTKRSLEVVELVVFDNSNGAACDDLPSAIAPSALTRSNGQVLVVDDITGCYPEQVAIEAQKENFVGVIFASPYRYPGYSATVFWFSNSAPIPLFELSDRDLHTIRDDLNENQTLEINSVDPLLFNVTGSAITLESTTNVIVIYLVSAIVLFLCLLQLLLDVPRLLRLLFTKHIKLNMKLAICFLQLFSALIKIFAFSYDPVGLFHRMNFLTFRILTFLTTQAMFMTMYMLAVTVQKALKTASYVWSQRYPYILGLFSFLYLCVLGFDIISLIAVSYQVLDGEFLRAAGIIQIAYLFLSGAYFIFSKSVVVATFMGLIQNTGKERAAKIRSMAHHLILSIFPMIGYALSMAVYLFYYENRWYQAVPLFLSVQMLTLIEIMLLNSLPWREGSAAMNRSNFRNKTDPVTEMKEEEKADL